MKIRKLLATVGVAILGLNAAKASHISGGEILYECLGGNQYAITMNLFRDCVGIDMATVETIQFNSPCGSVTLSVNLASSSEISQLCPGDIGNSACSGGSLPGMEIYTYTGVVTLPPCDTWTMSWSSCCRNDAILNLVAPGGLDTYLEATLNSATFTCDNSPVFNNVPIPYVCLNQPVYYSFGVSESDGDSLGYTFIAAMEAGAIPVPYMGGYTFAQPIPGIVLDPISGLMTFTPTLQGNFVVTVLVTQYDEDGNVIGTVMRDIQFVVIPCTNQSPDPTTGTIANFVGTATPVGSYNVEMCETDNFCFDFTIVDPDALQTLTLLSNIASVLPGATFSYSGTNPVNGSICWTAPAGSAGFHAFIITAIDDACPVSAFQTYVYTVNVLTRTSAGPDQTLCGTQVAQLDANGGAVFTWSVITGDPINIGVNFSCNPCEAPIADPAITTTYLVQSDLSGSCINSDTVTVFVVPDFTYQVTQADTILCLGATVQFNVTVNPPGSGYSYLWEPATGLDDPNSADPIGSYINPGTYSYTVYMTSPDDCVHLDTSITVIVTPGYIPQFTVTQADEFICEGETTQFFVTLDCSMPEYCGLYSGPCCGPLSTVEAGTDTQTGTTTSYPAPFGHFYEGVKHQILFRADELQALGFSGGKISELAWNISTINGATQYFDWDVRMGCTTQSEFTGVWIDGLTPVFFDDTLNIVVGWNTFIFPTAYNWDGVSNLIVEVCFNNDIHLPTYTQNSPTYYTATTWNSVQYRNNDNTPTLCPSPGLPVLNMNRPNTRFQFCGGVDAANIVYSWSPPGGLSDPTSPNPFVTPTSSPVSYTVTVGELGSGCTDEATVTVAWYPNPDVSFIPEPDEGVAPFSVFFNNTSASKVVFFDWVFGDGSDTSGVFEPSNIYTSPGVYYIILTGTDVNGCVSTYIDSILVLDEPIVVIPNVFSPNGDGSNDAFAFIDFRGFRDYTMKIFNRWGMEIHRSSSVNQNLEIWAPKNNTPDGTYFYEFIGNGFNGEQIKRTGHITLLGLKP